MSTTAVHAPDRTPDTRTKIGVCETVTFTLGGPVADWTADTGWPSARGRRASFEWAAPEEPGMPRITATIPATGQTCTLDMEVVAPEEIRFRRDTELAFPAGSAGAGMRLEVRAHPRDVNFGWVALREDPGPASGVTGYFAALAAAGADLAHHPNPDFVRFNFNNAIRFDTAATVPGVLPPPWTPGAFRWDIPNRYRCFNSTGAGHVFDNTQQRFSIDAAGTVTVRKDGRTVTRTP
jgi:hypothetical protein